MNVVVAGIGYAGLAIARTLRAAGHAVTGLAHSEESAARVREELAAEACDIADRAAVERFAAAREGSPDAVIHCASSGRGEAEAYRAVYLEGARNLLEALKPARLIFTSSTSVYAQTDGGWVNELSAAQPQRETGRILRETETLVLHRGGAVARLAGIYGPGRSVLLRKFLRGEAVIEGDGKRMINQVHRDDIATAIALLAERGAQGIYNVCDDRPIEQAELYTWLAQKFDRPVPPSGPVDVNRKRGWTNKRVCNAKLCTEGWEMKWPSFFDAVRGDAELVRLAWEESVAV